MASAGAERVPVTSVRADLPELVIRNVTDRGTLGKRFKVLVNHVPVKILPDRRTFYRCRIDVMNERGDTVRDMSLCRALAKAWSKFERSPLYKRPYTYDASHLIFLTEPLDKEVYEDQLTIRDDGPYSSGGQRVLNVVLKAAGVVDLGKLVNVKGGRKGFHPEDITSSLQV